MHILEEKASMKTNCAFYSVCVMLSSYMAFILSSGQQGIFSLEVGILMKNNCLFFYFSAFVTASLTGKKTWCADKGTGWRCK